MEGISYLALSFCCCTVSLISGSIVFGIVQWSSKKVFQKKFENKNSTLFSIAVGSVFAIIVAVIYFYTQIAPASPDYYQPKKMPKQEDIVGEWIPQSDTIEYLEELGYNPDDVSIVFYIDGTFEMTNIPNFIYNNDQVTAYSGNGTWEMRTKNSISITALSLSPPYSSNNLSRPTPCPGESVPCGVYITSFGLWNREPPYDLILYNPKLYFARVGDVHE